MAFGGNILLAAAGSSNLGGLNLVISSNTQDYNVLTAAIAIGYNNSEGEDVTITLTINQGVNVTSTSQFIPALRTGALNANTTLAITNNGNIEGHVGATAGGSGNGDAGGDGLYFETVTGGSATHSLINSSTGIISGGGGGGGGGGVLQSLVSDGDGGQVCDNPAYAGPAGAVGSVGQAGANGTYGSGSTSCIVTTPGSGAGAGYALFRNGRTIAVTQNGTMNGIWT